MRPVVVALLLAVPTVTLPLHGGGDLHLLRDSVVGVVVGVAVVALYMLALRRIERSRSHAPRDDPEDRGASQRSQDP